MKSVLFLVIAYWAVIASWHLWQGVPYRDINWGRMILIAIVVHVIFTAVVTTVMFLLVLAGPTP